MRLLTGFCGIILASLTSAQTVEPLVQPVEPLVQQLMVEDPKCYFPPSDLNCSTVDSLTLHMPKLHEMQGYCIINYEGWYDLSALKEYDDDFQCAAWKYILWTADITSVKDIVNSGKDVDSLLSLLAPEDKYFSAPDIDEQYFLVDDFNTCGDNCVKVTKKLRDRSHDLGPDDLTG